MPSSSSTLICAQTPGVSRVLGRALLPGVVTEFPRPRHGVEYPEAFAGLHIEAAHITFYVGLAPRLFAGTMSGTDDDRVAGDDRRGMQPDVRSDQVHLLVVIQAKIDHTILAEGGYRDTRFCIQRNQAGSRA